MSLEIDPPPADLLAQFGQLEATLTDDASGEKTRRLMKYLEEARLRSRESQLHTTDFDERGFAGMVSDAFDASSHILAAAWRKHHGKDLPI